jgi:hypothetical protein
VIKQREPFYTAQQNQSFYCYYLFFYWPEVAMFPKKIIVAAPIKREWLDINKLHQ